MKTYVITLSKAFPTTHPRKGQGTAFAPALRNGQTCRKCKENNPAMCMGECFSVRKLHTIRANYDFWKKRFEQIAAGNACLSIRQWVGKPYGKGSTQREIVRLTREDGIGIQELRIVKEKLNSRPIYLGYVDGKQGDFNFFQELAVNDGLSFNDWFDWFKGYDLSQPMAIIHFTKFRY